jgi:hypothetical protein
LIGFFSTLFAATTIEIVELFSSGVILAATVYTASKSGRKPRNTGKKR